MALTQATITFDVSDYASADFDPRRTKVYATNNVPGGAVIDGVGNHIFLGSGTGTIGADGTGSISVPTPGTGSNPASWQTTVHIDYPDRNAPSGRTVKSFGPFTITTSANLADLVAEMPVQPEYAAEVFDRLDALEADTGTGEALAELETRVADLEENPAGNSGGRESATISGAHTINAVDSRTYELTLTGDATLAIDGGLPGDQLDLAVFTNGHGLTIGEHAVTGSGMTPVVLWLVDGDWYVIGGASVLTGAPYVPTDTTPPGAPTNLAATPTNNTIVFTWDRPTTEGNDVDYYEISTDNFTTVQKFLDSGYITRTLTLAGLAPATAYTIKIRARDLSGNLGPAAQIIATTTGGTSNTAPTAPGNLAYTTRSGTSVTLGWNAATDDVGVVAYRVSKDGGATWISQSILDTFYTVTGLTPGTSYNFRVQAGDAAGLWSASASLTASTTSTLPENALLRFALDEGSGTTSLEGGGTLQLTGIPTWGIGHVSGWAARGGLVSIPGGINTAALPGFTAMLWIDIGQGEGPGVIMHGAHHSANDWPTFRIIRTGTTNNVTGLRSELSIGGSGDSGGISTSLSTTNSAVSSSGARVWAHYAVTWEASTGLWIHYVNGVETGRKTQLGTFASSHPVDSGGVPTNWMGIIGIQGDGGGDGGFRDDVRIFGRALTAGEVQGYMGQKVT